MRGWLLTSILLLITLVPMVPLQTGAGAALAPGVAESLARARAERISNVRYTLAFTIPAALHAPIAARETIAFSLADASSPLVLDFQPDHAGLLRGLTIAGHAVDVQQTNGHIVVPPAVLKTGENTIDVAFEAGDAPLNRNSDYLYTIFVPARAHEAFPCFDQPDLKARWTLSLDVPDGWQTLANGAERSHESSGGRTRVHFAQTQPISTYLFAFAAGHFFVETAQRDGRTFRMFHRETDAAKVARNRDAIFDLHAAALKWLEQYTGIPYPFGKFDFLLVPAFQFGGMEHPGAIFYNASGLMLDQSATQNQELARASTIAHETTHMWFGDLVTMKWFSDVWMKEVMANFMAAKIVDPSFPHINHALRFLLAYYPSAYAVDRTPGSNAIRQPLTNLSDAGTLYGAIIYQKAPIVMRNLEALLGPDAFRDGLREYLKQYAFGNASWSDLIALLARHTKIDLAAWSHAWVEEAGRPIITTHLIVDHGRIARLTFSQRDPVAGRGLTWRQQLQVAVGDGRAQTLLPVTLAGPSVEVAAARGLPTPAFVLPNGAGLGYGEFHLDPASRTWLAAHLPEIDDPLTRGSAWLTLWDAMLDHELAPAATVDLALRALPRETDELNTQRILGYLSETYWQFTPQTTRLRIAPHVEQVLRDGLTAAATTSSKAAYFSTLRQVAQTPATVAWLTSIWRGDTKVPGLIFSENDDIALAEELAVRGVPDAMTIVDRQIARTKNPDRKAQLQFVEPALSPDPAARGTWFASLKEVANRRHEPWVLTGLRYLHHPLRAASSERYIEPSLEMLQEIQRTGDIFFPKRWMDATLDGSRSQTAAATVRDFLAKLPNTYPDRLRRVILSSADTLFRVTDQRPGARPQTGTGR
ncbi:MAG TPA: M1 family aminopeptidase [Vicinamibacterales bacterium]|nr:M1 family aminopeptidase [Vicinamibacterales bacterium]